MQKALGLMQSKKFPADYVLVQSAQVLRRVAVIRDYGFTFDKETSMLVDETIALIDKTISDIVKEANGGSYSDLNDAPCSGRAEKNNS